MQVSFRGSIYLTALGALRSQKVHVVTQMSWSDRFISGSDFNVFVCSNGFDLIWSHCCCCYWTAAKKPDKNLLWAMEQLKTSSGFVPLKRYNTKLQRNKWPRLSCWVFIWFETPQISAAENRFGKNCFNPVWKTDNLPTSSHILILYPCSGLVRYGPSSSDVTLRVGSSNVVGCVSSWKLYKCSKYIKLLSPLIYSSIYTLYTVLKPVTCYISQLWSICGKSDRLIYW